MTISQELAKRWQQWMNKNPGHRITRAARGYAPDLKRWADEPVKPGETKADEEKQLAAIRKRHGITRERYTPSEEMQIRTGATAIVMEEREKEERERARLRAEAEAAEWKMRHRRRPLGEGMMPQYPLPHPRGPYSVGGPGPSLDHLPNNQGSS